MGLFNLNPQQLQGLLGLSQGLLQASGPSALPQSFGEVFGQLSPSQLEKAQRASREWRPTGN